MAYRSRARRAASTGPCHSACESAGGRGASIGRCNLQGPDFSHRRCPATDGGGQARGRRATNGGQRSALTHKGSVMLCHRIPSGKASVLLDVKAGHLNSSHGLERGSSERDNASCELAAHAMGNHETTRAKRTHALWAARPPDAAMKTSTREIPVEACYLPRTPYLPAGTTRPGASVRSTEGSAQTLEQPPATISQIVRRRLHPPASPSPSGGVVFAAALRRVGLGLLCLPHQLVPQGASRFCSRVGRFPRPIRANGRSPMRRPLRPPQTLRHNGDDNGLQPHAVLSPPAASHSSSAARFSIHRPPGPLAADLTLDCDATLSPH
ncbi:hypothetical protein ACCO45_006311 [Purpureocillium lilacinum]|uniref:Uncharacterized protein n=1 Tax=Purpureocillium lilacinum TaxID=33203 RepID=A0ACC4DSY4_PURLI